MTAGPTVEKIDPVRVMTNISTGKTGTSIGIRTSFGWCKSYLRSMDRELQSHQKVLKIIPVKTVTDMFNAVKKELKKKFDVVILAAAVSDFIPKNSNAQRSKSNKNTVYQTYQSPKDHRSHQKDSIREF